MLSALSQLAPLAIDLLPRNYYSHGGYSHGGHPMHNGGHYMHGGYAHGGYAHGGHIPGHYMDGGYEDGGLGQVPQEGSPNGGTTEYVQHEPNMNAPMAPYAYGGYAHGGHHPMHGGGHYMDGGYTEGGPIHHSTYAGGGHARSHHQAHYLHHYGFGGALKSAYNAAKPGLSQMANKGVNYAAKQAGSAAQGYATKHLGAEAGQMVGNAARQGVQGAGQHMQNRAGLSRPAGAPPAPPAQINVPQQHQQQPMQQQPQQQQAAPQQQEEYNAMNELPFANERRGGYMHHRAGGGALYPYQR